MKRGRWFLPGFSHRGSAPEPAPGSVSGTNATWWPPRPRAAIEADLRELPTLRVGIHTGDLRADQLFGELVTRRADRLLDELLRSGNGSEGATGGGAGTSSSAGSEAASTSSPAIPVTGTTTELRSTPPSIHLVSGTYTFTMSSAGQGVQAIERRSPGVDGQTSDAAGPEGSVTLTVTLQPGTYQLWCPAGDDRDAGIQTMLRVG